jgi:hypothetical protein
VKGQWNALVLSILSAAVYFHPLIGIYSLFVCEDQILSVADDSCWMIEVLVVEPSCNESGKEMFPRPWAKKTGTGRLAGLCELSLKTG